MNRSPVYPVAWQAHPGTWDAARRRLMFLMVDIVLDALRRLHWGRRLWPQHHTLWRQRQMDLGWWRSTWVAS